MKVDRQTIEKLLKLNKNEFLGAIKFLFKNKNFIIVELFNRYLKINIKTEVCKNINCKICLEVLENKI